MAIAPEMLVASGALQVLRQVAFNGDDKLSSAVLTLNAEVSDFAEIHAEDTGSGHEPIMPQDETFAYPCVNPN